MAKRKTCKPTHDRESNRIPKWIYCSKRHPKKRIWTDPVTIFRGEKSKEFCKNHFITHIECPIQDHRGNGKVERLIRTISERIRAEKTIITEKRNAGLTRLLFALRTAVTANRNSPFENVFGQKPNTIKNILIEKPKNCLEKRQCPTTLTRRLPERQRFNNSDEKQTGLKTQNWRDTSNNEKDVSWVRATTQSRWNQSGEDKPSQNEISQNYNQRVRHTVQKQHVRGETASHSKEKSLP